MSLESMKAYNRPHYEFIGSFMYLACAGRPDIMYLPRFLSCYNDTHRIEAKRVLYYLLPVKSIGQCYGIIDEEFGGHADLDWVGSKVGREPTSGRVQKFSGASFMYSNKRQSIVTTLSVESEHVSLSKCIGDAS